MTSYAEDEFPNKQAITDPDLLTLRLVSPYLGSKLIGLEASRTWRDRLRGRITRPASAASIVFSTGIAIVGMAGCGYLWGTEPAGNSMSVLYGACFIGATWALILTAKAYIYRRNFIAVSLVLASTVSKMRSRRWANRSHMDRLVRYLRLEAEARQEALLASQDTAIADRLSTALDEYMKGAFQGSGSEVLK